MTKESSATGVAAVFCGAVMLLCFLLALPWLAVIFLERDIPIVGRGVSGDGSQSFERRVHLSQGGNLSQIFVFDASVDGFISEIFLSSKKYVLEADWSEDGALEISCVRAVDGVSEGGDVIVEYQSWTPSGQSFSVNGRDVVDREFVIDALGVQVPVRVN